MKHGFTPLGFNHFNHYVFSGNYVVRCYDKQGNGMCCYHVDTLEEAKTIRTLHGLSIGLEPEPTYKDFPYYPTIWKWIETSDDPYMTTPCYDRVHGY